MGKLYQLRCPLKLAAKIVEELTNGFAETNRRQGIEISTTYWTPETVTRQNASFVPTDERLQATYLRAFDTSRDNELAAVAGQFGACVELKERGTVRLETTIFDKTLLDAVLPGKHIALPELREHYFSSLYYDPWGKILYDSWIKHRDEGLLEAHKNLDSERHRVEGQCGWCQLL